MGLQGEKHDLYTIIVLLYQFIEFRSESMFFFFFLYSVLNKLFNTLIFSSFFFFFNFQ